MKARLRADDRVLFLRMPPAGVLAAAARILMQGTVVALGSAEEVDEARRTLAEFNNLMIVESEVADIPWRDAYFTKIIVAPELAAQHRTAGAEWARLLAPNGQLVMDVEEA